MRPLNYSPLIKYFPQDTSDITELPLSTELNSVKGKWWSKDIVANIIYRSGPGHYPADSVVCFVNTYQLDSDLSRG